MPPHPASSTRRPVHVAEAAPTAPDRSSGRRLASPSSPTWIRQSSAVPHPQSARTSSSSWSTRGGVPSPICQPIALVSVKTLEARGCGALRCRRLEHAAVVRRAACGRASAHRGDRVRAVAARAVPSTVVMMPVSRSIRRMRGSRCRRQRAAGRRTRRPFGPPASPAARTAVASESLLPVPARWWRCPAAQRWIALPSRRPGRRSRRRRRLRRAARSSGVPSSGAPSGSAGARRPRRRSRSCRWRVDARESGDCRRRRSAAPGRDRRCCAAGASRARDAGPPSPQNPVVPVPANVEMPAGPARRPCEPRGCRAPRCRRARPRRSDLVRHVQRRSRRRAAVASVAALPVAGDVAVRRVSDRAAGSAGCRGRRSRARRPVRSPPRRDC